ncbi:MAG: SlyX family protein [Steroidobacteraceae bacterium]|jgi:SlyX protein
MNEAVERLEIKVAYLERANAELSDELYRQRQLLDALVSRHADLLRRLDETAAAPASADPLSEKPPHY